MCGANVGVGGSTRVGVRVGGAGIPAEWRQLIGMRDKIEALAGIT